MSLQEPLLDTQPNASRVVSGWLRRAGVAAVLLCGAIALALLLPVNKNLPCPWCQISGVIGWLYFLFWSVSFWPQVFINIRRKSVEGLSFDFTVLNVLGFACYTQFNLSLFLSPVVRGEYMQRFGTTDVPVELNDVVFGLHALIMSLVLAIQCLVYPKHDTQSVSLGTTLGISGATAAAGSMALYLAVVGESTWPFTWLDLFIKMAVTLVKYIPQVVMNHSRQSTDGWSIDNVLLDLSGGLLSVAQLLVSCQVLNDWKAITGNPIKFGLGLVSLGFDVVFILQHYVWFRPQGPAQEHAKAQQQQQQQGVMATADDEEQGRLLQLNPSSSASASP